MRRVLWMIGLTGALLGTQSVCAPAADDAGLAFFEKKIRPVLVAHCYECHSAKSKILRGGLLVDSRVGMRKGGESGPAVVPGKPDESMLLDALRHESFEMPPKGKLPDAVIADFERWIRVGAPDPRVEEVDLTRHKVDLESGREFWSFQPIEKSPVPSTHDKAWPRSAIDRFLLSRWEEEGLKRNGSADRRTLLRRVYFDLIGLPPSPEEIEAFLADDAPDALTAVVDRLLASPQFGERWGRHWLDVARFAESSGGGRTLLFPNAWRYRDYVIKSLNEDKPLDRFITEQIAGDLLPYSLDQERHDNLTALGFLMLGPTNYELQDKELLRMEVVDEQLDTMGRAFLGMTIGCARCHDHKFDPIPTRDYYALAGIFRSTKTLTPGNVAGFETQPLPILDPDHRRQLEAYHAHIEPLQSRVKQIQAELKKLGATSSSGANSVALAKLPGLVLDESQAKQIGNWSASQSIPRFVGDGYHYAGRGQSQMRYELTVLTPGRYEVRVSYNAHPNRSPNVPVTITHADGEKTTRINQKKNPPIDGLFISLGEFRFQPGKPAVVVISCEDIQGTAIADAVQLLPVSESGTGTQLADETPDPQQIAREQRIDQLQQELSEAEAEIKQLEKSAPPAAPVAMAVREENEPGDFRVCIRGNVHNLGEPVPRGFLQVASTGEVQFPEEESGRRQLADWLIDPGNPLTARVAVNRIWLHLFGRGLVATPDNFGATGTPPSHPELLDWLAVRFVEDGWSVKSLIREIMLSRAYQMSSDVDPENARVDKENILLWRMNRRRLEAEAIRDTMLAIADQLDGRMNGPAIRPGTKSSFGYRFDTDRRSVYVPIFRNTLLDVFSVFDFADPNIVSGKRNVSTLATQALFLMNSPFVTEQSARAAERLLADEELNSEQRIEFAYEQVLGRPPTRPEFHMTQRLLQESGADHAAWTTVYQSLFSSVDFRYLR